MNRIDDRAPVAQEVVNCLAEELELGHSSLEAAEDKILQINCLLGALMLKEVVE